MRQEISKAAYHLSILYRCAAYPLTEALCQGGLPLNHSCPRVTPGQPYQITGAVGELEQVRRKVKDTGILRVSSDFSDHTVYELPADNAWFRFIHDMGHLLYNCEFDSAGETKLHPLVWQWLATVPQFHALTDDEKRWCWAVYMADTQGQSEYFDKHGEFPTDQAAFVAQEAEVYYAKA